MSITRAKSFAGSSKKEANHAPVDEYMALVFTARISVIKNESIAPARISLTTNQIGTFLRILSSKKSIIVKF